MPKSPGVEYVITKPAAPSLWKRHRHEVLFVVGILIGIWLASGHGGQADSPPANHPHSGVPATPGVHR